MFSLTEIQLLLFVVIKETKLFILYFFNINSYKYNGLVSTDFVPTYKCRYVMCMFVYTVLCSQICYISTIICYDYITMHI